MRLSSAASRKAEAVGISAGKRWSWSRQRCAGEGLVAFASERVLDSSAASILPFVRAAVAPGSLVITDGLPTYLGLPESGYRHRRRSCRGSGENPDALLPRVHQVASLLKRWLLGTHQGAVDRAHLPYYLDEFTFRFNRRTSRAAECSSTGLSSTPSQLTPHRTGSSSAAPSIGSRKMLGQLERRG